MGDSGRDRFEEKIATLVRQFRAPGWEGPFRYTPEETEAEYVLNEKDAPLPSWMVYMVKEGTIEDFHHPGKREDLVERVKFLVNNETEADAITIKQLALKLTIGVAARAAHDSLDGTFLDDQLIVGPHSPVQIDQAAKMILDCLHTGAGEEDE